MKKRKFLLQKIRLESNFYFESYLSKLGLILELMFSRFKALLAAQGVELAELTTESGKSLCTESIRSSLSACSRSLLRPEENISALIHSNSINSHSSSKFCTRGDKIGRKEKLNFDKNNKIFTPRAVRALHSPPQNLSFN